MLAKEHKSFISLVAGKSKPEVATMGPEKSMPMGPTFYVHEVRLPVSGEDVGKKQTATVQLRLVSYSQRTDAAAGEGRTYEFEVIGIKFEG